LLVTDSGTLVNLKILVVAEGSKAEFKYGSGNKLDKSTTNSINALSLDTLEVMSFGLINLGLDSNQKFTLNLLNNLHIKHSGILTARNLKIVSPNVQVAFDGELSVSEQGSSAGSGTGAGFEGSGASYGGCGGESSKSSSPSVSMVGDIFAASASGSGGGNTSSGGTGGRGGGLLQLDVTNLLTLQGSISSNGQGGVNGGGGGSGGAVSINVQHIIGSGNVSVSGGNATNGGGGGGGGRVIMIVQKSNNFTGDYLLSGGSAVGGSSGGGSGTAYILTRSDNKYEEVYTDNRGTTGVTIAKTVLNTGTTKTKAVNKLVLGTNVDLHIVEQQVHFTAKQLVCNGGSMLNINNDTILSADVGISYSKLACSIVLSKTGEVRLPPKVELLGAGNDFQGKIYFLFLYQLWLILILFF